MQDVLAKKQVKDKVRDALRTHYADRQKNGFSQIDNMVSAMNKHFEYIKTITGIKKEVEETPEHTKSNNAFMLLRPESPYKLSQLLSDSFNPDEVLPGSI